MTLWAWVENSKVRDVCLGGDPNACYHPDIAVHYSTQVPNGTINGATLANGVWTNPTPPAAPAPPPPVLPDLTPMQFYLAFTPAERMAIKSSTDAIVVEFWATYQLAVSLQNNINPNLTSVVEALTYLATPKTATPPGAGILTSTDRIAQIQAGIAQ